MCFMSGSALSRLLVPCMPLFLFKKKKKKKKKKKNKNKFTHAIARIRTCHLNAPGRPRVLRLHLAKHVIEQKMKGSLAI